MSTVQSFEVFGDPDNWFFSKGVARPFGENKCVSLDSGETILNVVQPLVCDPVSCGLKKVGTLQASL